MSWIDEIDEQEASGELAVLYRELIAQRGKIANILKVHSLNPPALKGHLDLYMTLLFGRSGLSRAQRESIAVVTSANNHCDYCVNHHAASLAGYEHDPEVVDSVRTGEDFSRLAGKDVLMLEHARRLTNEPEQIRPSDLDTLREAGFSDRDILDITLVTAYFNFVNRIALGLGVEFNEDELGGYKN